LLTSGSTERQPHVSYRSNASVEMALGMSASPPTSDLWLRRSELTLRAPFRHRTTTADHNVSELSPPGTYMTSRTNSAKARALAVAVRRAGKTAHRSIRGNCQSFRTTFTVPSAISGANIHSETIARPAFARTAARRPSAAVTRSRPFNVTAICVPSR